ncbi:MAG: DUF433 domain-containing protein [Candidatus Uhrbacteria bacterium]|nr:DUF433 domain-containing protein [Candidatus Uhrbacteria bacterium]
MQRIKRVIHPKQKVLIHQDPKVLGGKPVIAGTRLSVEFILELLAAGMTSAAIVREYGVSEEAVFAAVNFAVQQLKREDAFVRQPA